LAKIYPKQNIKRKPGGQLVTDADDIGHNPDANSKQLENNPFAHFSHDGPKRASRTGIVRCLGELILCNCRREDVECNTDAIDY